MLADSLCRYRFLQSTSLVPSKRDMDLFAQPCRSASLRPVLVGLWLHTLPYTNASKPRSAVTTLLVRSTASLRKFRLLRNCHFSLPLKSFKILFRARACMHLCKGQQEGERNLNRFCAQHRLQGGARSPDPEVTTRPEIESDVYPNEPRSPMTSLKILQLPLFFLF